MRTVRLGSTGLKVTPVCLGTMSFGSTDWNPWVMGEEEAGPFFRRALEAGINFFDTADMYSRGRSEEIVGRWLAELAPRHELVIATKVFATMSDDPNDRGLSRKHVMDAIDNSLRRLRTDYVDLYQIHRWDPETPIEETMEALNDIVRAGKARYIGASSMWAWQFARAQHTAERHGWTRFVSMQNHYNLLYREEERDMIPLCIDQGVGCIPWSPLARGVLARGGRGGDGDSGRSRTDENQRNWYPLAGDRTIAERVGIIAGRRGVAPASVALAWLLNRPGVSSPVFGATRLSHIDAAVAAVDLVLDDEECAWLEEPYEPHRVAGHS